MKFFYLLVVIASVVLFVYASPPKVTKLFTAEVVLGSSLPRISNPGSVTVVEPIINGTISGVFNGTFLGGFARPDLWNETVKAGGPVQTIQAPTVAVYGKTNDGEGFYINEAGIGTPDRQVTRIELSVSGKHAYLSNAFLIGIITPTYSKGTVGVEIYEVA